MDLPQYEGGPFNQGYINVYLPREDGNFFPRHVPPPSPVFDLQTVYKFSDQVHHDRHLFLGRRRYYRHYADEEDLDSVSNKSSLTDSGYQSINVVKLNVDASANKNGMKGSNTRPLNERLSAYVQRRKPPQAQTEQDRSLSSQSARSIISEPGSSPKPVNQGFGLRRSKTISFHHGDIKELEGIEKLPLLGPSKTFTRDTTKLRRQKTLLVSGGGFKMPKSLTRLPLRPPSKPINIYRQSTDIFGKGTTHQLELFSPTNMTLKINSLKPQGLTPGYLLRQRTSASNTF